MRILAKLGLVVGALSALEACASINGPKPVVDAVVAQKANNAYINGDVLGAFYSPSANLRNGLTPLQWRNTVVGAQLDAAEQNYAAYVSALRSDRSRLALLSDLVVVGLTEGGSVAAKATANALSAASAGVVGASAAVNKDVYYNATIEALISQMDADRATVRADIEKGLRSSETAYPLDVALSDVRRFEAAGTMERAIVKVSASANAAKVDAEANLQLARDAAFVAAEPAAARLVDRVIALSDAQALSAWIAMKPKLSERSATLQLNVKAIVKVDKVATGATARRAMEAWLSIDDRTADSQKEWSDALDAATK